MAFVPLSYNLRSLVVRRTATLLTVLGIGATVAVLAGVLALQQGFATLFVENGRDDVVVFLRQGSTNEGDSVFSLERAQILMKSLPDIERPADGPPLVSAEMYLAVRREKVGGGETNVPIRGVQQGTFLILGDDIRLVEGRNFAPGTDEVVVGSKLADRIADCRVGDTLVLNTTPFKVVGMFDHPGPFKSEIWGDRDRLAEALERPVFNRVVAKLKAGVDLDELKERMESDPQVPCKVMTEREYLGSQTTAFSFVLRVLGAFLAAIMGVAAVFTATNTMLAALAARTNEIGILLSLGFKPWAIFASFLFESLVLGLLGGVVGCLMALPLNGVDTGAMNFQTFTEVAFAFRVTPQVMVVAVGFSLALGLLGGALPALRAASLRPTQALRRD
ncbi:MAG: ABC transporter permease [Planctomycetia bacterium]|jgi:putative ABC transport system permease protein